MSGKTGRKDFKSLFGGDESDEENLQALEFHGSKLIDMNQSDKTMNKLVEKHKHSNDKHKHNSKNVEEDCRINDEREHRKKYIETHQSERGKEVESDRYNQSDIEEGEQSQERKRLRSIDGESDIKRKKIENNGDNQFERYQMNQKDVEPPEIGKSLEHKEILVESENPSNNNEKEIILDFQQVKSKQNGESSKKQRLKKTEVAGLVVKLLTPAYVERRFESRDIFKILARNISHALVDKDEQEITEYVKNFLKKNEEITSQTTL